MEPAAAAQVRFVSTWSDLAKLSDLDEETLKNNADAPDRTCTSVFEAAVGLRRHA